MNAKQRDPRIGRWDNSDGKYNAKPQIPERNAAGIAYPSIEEQKAYWETHDHGGNILPDRIEANEDRYGN